MSNDNLAQALDAFQLAVPVRHIATSREEFLCATEGMSETDVLGLSRRHEHRYDILPIRARATQPITEYWTLERCASNDVVSASKQQVAIRDLIESQARVVDLIRVFCRDQKQFLFILEQGDVAGIVTVSDLNKPAVCVGLFPLVQRVELAMRNVITKLLPGEEWIDDCRKKRQSKIKGIVKKRRNENHDIGSLSIALFSDLTCVCSAGKVARHCFDGCVDTTLVEERKLLNDLRDRVCHAVESLLDDKFGIEKVGEAILVSQRWSDSLCKA